MFDTKFTFVGSAFVALSSWNSGKLERENPKTFPVINTKFHWGILQTNCLIFSLHSAGNCTGRGLIIAKYQLSPTYTLLVSAWKFSGHVLQTTILNGDKADSKILHLYLGQFKINQVKPH